MYCTVACQCWSTSQLEAVCTMSVIHLFFGACFLHTSLCIPHILQKDDQKKKSWLFVAQKFYCEIFSENRHGRLILLEFTTRRHLWFRELHLSNPPTLAFTLRSFQQHMLCLNTAVLSKHFLQRPPL